MRRLFLVVLSVVVVLLQASLLPALRPFGVVPNLLLVFVVLTALEGTASSALIIAVAGGFTLDLASGANFGLWTGTLVTAALAAGLLHRAGVEVDRLLVSGTLVTAGTVLMSLVILLGLAGSVSSWPVGVIAYRILVELVINLSLILVLRLVVRRVSSGPRQNVQISL